ncbi:MAG: hypothetical protein AB1324_00840 [Candidatus Micrarchaeota archaeon]
MQSAQYLASSAENAARGQETFDKIVSVADHTVKIGAARSDGGIRHPNWILAEKITEAYTESVRAQSGLRALYIGMEKPGGIYDFCIYRLVVSGPEKSPGRVFVCGSG